MAFRELTWSRGSLVTGPAGHYDHVRLVVRPVPRRALQSDVRFAADVGLAVAGSTGSVEGSKLTKLGLVANLVSSEAHYTSVPCPLEAIMASPSGFPGAVCSQVPVAVQHASRTCRSSAAICTAIATN